MKRLDHHRASVVALSAMILAGAALPLTAQLTPKVKPPLHRPWTAQQISVELLDPAFNALIRTIHDGQADIDRGTGPDSHQVAEYDGVVREVARRRRAPLVRGDTIFECLASDPCVNARRQVLLTFMGSQISGTNAEVFILKRTLVERSTGTFATITTRYRVQLDKFVDGWVVSSLVNEGEPS